MDGAEGSHPLFLLGGYSSHGGAKTGFWERDTGWFLLAYAGVSVQEGAELLRLKLPGFPVDSG